MTATTSPETSVWPSYKNPQKGVHSTMGSMPAPQHLRLIRPITSVHVSTKAMPYNHPHPSLEVTGGALHTFLPALKTLSRPYSPFPVIGWNCHVETIFAAFFRSLPDIKLKRECIRTKDDGSVALDWISGDHQLLPPDSPVLILMVRPLLFELFCFCSYFSGDSSLR